MATVAVRETLAQEYGTLALYASVHTSDPGTTGAGELTTVARQPITWNPGASDGQVISDPISFTIPAGSALTHVGIWSASTAGTFRDSYVNAITFETAGIYTTTLVYSQA